jgi:hypothetical protein
VPGAGGTKLSGLLVLLAAVGAGSFARAAERVGFAVDYDAPASCPDEAAFVAAILGRAPGAERVAAVSAAFAFEVHIAEQAGTARGYLLVRPPSGLVSRRDVPDASCAEIVASMAVIAALVIEGGTAEEVDAAPPASAAAPPAAPAREPAAPAIERPLPARPERNPPPKREPPPVSRPAPAPLPMATAGATGLRWRPGLALGVVIESAAAPTLVPGIAVGADLSADTDASFAPSARLTGFYVGSRRSTADGAADFQWLAVRLALSPLRWQKGALAVRPAVELDLGELRGTGENTVRGRTQSVFWLAVGPALHLEAELGRVVSLEAQLGARALRRNDRFLFSPDTEVYDMPRVSFGAILGAVARWP